MIHVVFNEPDLEVISKAIELDETLAGQILIVRDDYAVGPLENIYTTEGIENRKEWWRIVLEGGDYQHLLEEGIVNDELILEKLKEALHNDSNEEVWIWAAQNKHDVSGYFWLMSQLAEFQGRVMILYLNNLPFINEKGNIFYPEWLSQIPPREFIKAKKLARPITPSEFEVDTDEWSKICRDANGIRLLEGGKKLLPKPIEYYDNELLKFVTGDYQKASKIINQFLLKSKETTGDAFLLWRLKGFLASGIVELQGSTKTINHFELRKATASKVAE
jgi:hypothetical protein